MPPGKKRKMRESDMYLRNMYKKETGEKPVSFYTTTLSATWVNVNVSDESDPVTVTTSLSE